MLAISSGWTVTYGEGAARRQCNRLIMRFLLVETKAQHGSNYRYMNDGSGNTPAYPQRPATKDPAAVAIGQSRSQKDNSRWRPTRESPTEAASKFSVRQQQFRPWLAIWRRIQSARHVLLSYYRFILLPSDDLLFHRLEDARLHAAVFPMSIVWILARHRQC